MAAWPSDVFHGEFLTALVAQLINLLYNIVDRVYISGRASEGRR